ncbi:ATP-dependent RNA helicase in chromosome III [Loa loa]|uniref:RNA helicase n=1 Tax=Loa loa TaxID=7209 RepID=A0A1I7VW26_LOALO|nr:ATP-dependent RNA helicase in chromosome III [Loa loa]EFO20350.1 ATP-dependent RNA helicase in chromosome III [Loa loa]
MSDSSTDEDDAVPTQSVEEQNDDITFQQLGVTDVLCEACDRLNWKKPTKVQIAALPHAFKKRDIIGLAETGSGKTAAFAIPILQALLETPQKLFALVLTPTRELAFQIGEQFEALGASIGILIAVIVGGVDTVTQSLALAKRPHVIVATPGRLVDHLENTKGFNLRALKYLVMDEADRILNMDFEVEVEKILKVIPKERRTYLYSATMTKKVAKLERASLNDPVRIEVSSKYQTVDKLKQYYIFIPYKYKEAYLVYILNEMAGQTAIVFCSTCVSALRTALMLRKLGFGAVPLHGQMSQAKRLGSLNKFKSKTSTTLICTDVASRGLDIPHVDLVLNYDVPTQSKDYVHRVGRTARAGRSGVAVTFVTQYDVEIYQRIERLIGKKLPLFETVENDVMLLMERVEEAQKLAKREMKEMEEKKGRKRKQFDDDDDDEVNDAEESNAFRKKLKRKQKGTHNERRKF